MGKKQAVSCMNTQNGRGAGNRILEDKNGHELFETKLSTFTAETHLTVLKNKCPLHRRHTTSALQTPISESQATCNMQLLNVTRW
jgi:hypothetical protein